MVARTGDRSAAGVRQVIVGAGQPVGEWATAAAESAAEVQRCCRSG